MVDAATSKVVLGGLAHATDLANISRLAGEVDVALHTRSSGSTGTSHSTTTQRLPVLPIDKIRTLPAGRALVLARRCAPVEVQLQPSQTRGLRNTRGAITLRCAVAGCRTGE